MFPTCLCGYLILSQDFVFVCMFFILYTVYTVTSSHYLWLIGIPRSRDKLWYVFFIKVHLNSVFIFLWKSFFNPWMHLKPPFVQRNFSTLFLFGVSIPICLVCNFKISKKVVLCSTFLVQLFGVILPSVSLSMIIS